MKNISSLFFAPIILLTFASASIAGPFGVEKGMTLNQLNELGSFTKTNSPNVYKSDSMKQGHPDVEFYSVIVTPSHGLCKIQALTKDTPTSAYGTELQSKYNSLRSALVSKYGQPEKSFDFLRSGSIWHESREWMMSLLKKERYLASFWTSSNNLPDSLKTISIEAAALNSSKGFIKLGYEFDNIDQCLAEDKAASNANL